MLDKTLLTKVEQILSSTWGGDVQLSFQYQYDIDEHPHVARLNVQRAPPSAPPTVILKRWRIEGEERFSPEFSASHLFNEWANIRFLSTILGDVSPAPHIYAGDEVNGFLVIEDLGDINPLRDALWGSDPAKAAHTLIHYGEILGLLHGKTANQIDVYANFRRELDPDYAQPIESYLDFFKEDLKTLERIGIEVPSSALDDIHEAAATLTYPGSFTAFTHGDPVYGNIIAQQGRWRLIDFEAGRFRHALIEGSYPRMIFPTTGLRDVLRIPEYIWRQSEFAYRAVLRQHLPDAGDDDLYGSALTAACAFWTLTFCHTWLGRTIEGEGPAGMIKHIRGCAITRFEIFVATSREFQSLTKLGDFFDGLVAKLRSQWTEDDCNLPFYPAFVNRSAD